MKLLYMPSETSSRLYRDRTQLGLFVLYSDGQSAPHQLLSGVTLADLNFQNTSGLKTDIFRWITQSLKGYIHNSGNSNNHFPVVDFKWFSCREIVSYLPSGVYKSYCVYFTGVKSVCYYKYCQSCVRLSTKEGFVNIVIGTC